MTPGEWREAFNNSRLAKEFALPIQRVATVEELAVALRAGPTAWLAIINPYGESFPALAPGSGGRCWI
jgi:hypothetical protein